MQNEKQELLKDGLNVGGDRSGGKVIIEIGGVRRRGFDLAKIKLRNRKRLPKVDRRVVLKFIYCERLLVFLLAGPQESCIQRPSVSPNVLSRHFHRQVSLSDNGCKLIHTGIVKFVIYKQQFFNKYTTPVIYK